MSASDSREATDLLLASIYYDRAPHRSRHGFIYNRPGGHPLIGGMGIELNYDNHALTSAVLYLRRRGAPHLRAVSVSEVRSAITNFLSDNFWVISAEAWGGRASGPFLTFLSEGAKQALASAMAASNLFVEPRELTLFPLTVVRCEQSFICDEFFLIPPTALTPELMGARARPEAIAQASFPPFLDSDMRPHPVVSWLGVWAPSFETAKRMRATILGAIALLPHHLERYLFTGRTIVAGRCTMHGDRYTISVGEPHTPALSEDVVLNANDQPWLDILSSKLTASPKAAKRRMRALEYQYRSWNPDPVRRFPSLFGALDAIYGDASQATQAVVDAVGPIMGPEYDIKRLKLLLSLRASVIHGGAPNVYESSSYHRYYEAYYTDAVRDLELIVARCLQIDVFGGALIERPHTHSDLIYRQTGRQV